MKEVYGAGAFISRQLSKAASFVGEQSKVAADRMAQMQEKAREEELARQARQNLDGAADGQGDDLIDRGEEWVDDMADRFRVLARRARKEGGELAVSARREAQEAFDRIEGLVKRGMTKVDDVVDDIREEVRNNSRSEPPRDEVKEIILNKMNNDSSKVVNKADDTEVPPHF